MGLKELLNMYEICVLTAFLSQPDFQYCNASVCRLALMLVDLRGEIFDTRISCSCCAGEYMGWGDRWMIITQLQFQGLSGSPAKLFPLSSGGVASVCRISAKMDLHSKVEQLPSLNKCQC